MDLLTQLNLAMEYIEKNICEDISLDDISKVTLYSPYHFGRLFYYIADMPLSEYVRKRKLTRAATELQRGTERVIDIAVKYGYESAESFTRAFVKQHGVTPTSARQHGSVLKIFSPFSFQIKIKGAQNMNWKIEQKEAFEVLGIEKIFNKDTGSEISEFWEETRIDGRRVKLFEQAEDHKHEAVYGLVNYFDSGNDTIAYMIGIRNENNFNASGYKIVQIPKHTWVVFRAEGLNGHGDDQIQIGDLYHAFSEWLPSSGYKQFGCLQIEAYGNGFEEVWVTVAKG